MKKAPAVVMLAVSVAVAGCAEAGGDLDSRLPGAVSQVPGEGGATDPALRLIGQTVTLKDDEGRPMQVTLTGIAYRDAFAKDKTLPLNGKYALAVAFTMKSVTGGTLGQQRDNHIKWARGPEMTEAWDYTDAPWHGCTDAFTPYATVKANEEYKAIADLNVPVKGGKLLIEDHYGNIARWALPEADTGTGTEPATNFTTQNC
ncbi:MULTISPECIES: hypothetical protein [Streptomyces]|uniref:hypothetical protein n=1 Tax=Streptomyces TaxID=1883 RepID=UPI0022705FF5|nr:MULTISPECIES: hypothetical protein [unclassified Streptomyces]MCY0940268.1 hypothetical protein [Streptomyces sp. H34-AA3]MCZ4080915.1 hypothetical protein [Streptomyces sp. H34-S5]